ncbi:MAG TPA: hypothetical protein VF407_02630 [Polyangiaceae bacterium]
MAACILHVCIFAAIRAPKARPAPPAAETTIDIEDDVGATSPHEETQAPPDVTETTAATLAAATTARAAPGEMNARPLEAIAPPSDSALTAHPDAPPTGETWAFRTTQGGVDLGLGEKSGSLARSMFANGQLAVPKEPPPPEAPKPPPPVDPGVKMTQELDAYDVARGFGRGGPIVQAIEAVVHDATPPEGAATFEVTVEKNGNVAVRVTDASTRPEEWAKLASDIVKLVKTKAVRLPEKGNGMRFGIRVAASDVLPGGSSKPSMAPFGSGPLPPPSDRDDGAALSGNMRGGGPPLGAGFAPENIGAHKTRVVHAKEVYETRM